MLSVANQPLGAMLWELWQISRRDLLLRFGFVATCLLLLFAMSKSLDEPQMTVVRGIVVMLTAVACIFSTTWMVDFDNQQLGFIFRLGFTRPVSSRQLVLVPMLFSIAASMLGYLACGLIANLLLDLSLPLLGPALLIGFTVCLMISVVWSLTHTIEKLIAGFVVAATILGGLMLRHRPLDGEPILLAIGMPEYYRFQWFDYLGMASLSGLSMLVTIHAVGRQRHGEAIRWSWLLTSVFSGRIGNRFFETCKNWLETCTRPQVLRNSWSAQTWLELRRSGNLLVVVLATPLVVLAFIAGVPLINESWGGAHAPRMWLGVILFSPIFFQLLATDAVIGLRHNQGSTQLSQFDATRPFRCDEMIAIKLMAVSGWSWLGSLLMIAAAFAHSTFTWSWQYWQELQQAAEAVLQQAAAGNWNQAPLANPVLNPDHDGNSFGWLAIYGVVALFIAPVFSTALLMNFVYCAAKFPRVLFGGMLFMLANIGLFAWDVQAGQLGFLWRFYGYAAPLGLIALSILSIGTGIGSRQLSRRYVVVTLGLWLLLVLCNFLILGTLSSGAVLASVNPMLGMWGCAAVLAPLGAATIAPWAFAAFRHG